MLKKVDGKRLANKLSDVWHVTVRVVRRSEKAVSIKETVKNSTMSDFIGVAVLIMYPQGLYHVTKTEYVNQNVHKEGKTYE